MIDKATASVDAFKLPTWAERGGVYIRRLTRDAVLTIEQAAGLVGNLGFESDRFAAYHERGVPEDMGGVGVAQWTGTRRRAFENWCATHVLDTHSDDANYGFLLYELEGTHKTFASNLRHCITIEDACLLTHQRYEIPSDYKTLTSQPARLELAREALAGALDAIAAELPPEAPVPPTEPLPEAPVPTAPPAPDPIIAAFTDALTRLFAAAQPDILEDLKMTFSILQQIIDRILGHVPDAPKRGDTVSPVDVGVKLDELAAANPGLNVRDSIVDLMISLGFPPAQAKDIRVRRELADSLGVKGDVGTAAVNIAMHRALLQRVAENGGKVPPELLGS